MATDWTAVKLAYVHGTDTMRELAEKKGINAAGLMRRAAKEGWEAERKQESAKVSTTANAVLGDERAQRLAKFNDQDAKIAEALKAKAARILNGGDVDDKVLANLTRIFDGAQKIGLLALGAATENHSVTTKELPSSVDDFV
jgi:hypothetical protein